MRPPKVIILFLWILSCIGSRAKVLSDWQTGAQIVAPNEWRTSFTPSNFPGFGARSYNTKDFTSVDFNVDDQTTSEPLSEKSAFVNDFIKLVQSQGSVVSGSKSRQLNGNTFLVVSLSTKGASGTNFMNAWFIVVKEHTCGICLSVKNVDPDKNEILNGIIKSFSVTDHVLPRSPVLTKQEQLDQALKDNPFSFCGMVIDENKNPVPGATIKVLVQGELENGHKDTEHDLQSDGSGYFQLENVHSYGVNITASKDGYVTVSNDRGVWFWLIGGAKPSSMPTKEHPAIFRLQKKAPAPPKPLPL